MKNRSQSRGAMIVLCILLGLVLAVMLGGTVYATHLMNLMNRVEIGREETLSQEQVVQLLAEETVAPGEITGPVLNETDVDWGQGQGQVIKTGDHIVNILLIGQDAREGTERSRSDSMILVTFHKTKKTITLTSFLRDMYVKIPGYQDNKLNAAYAFGGMELLNRTLEENFGLQVHGNVEVNFARFASVIDLLGGVDMQLRQDEADYINSVSKGDGLQAGTQHLDGTQALYYARIRHLDSDSDFSRTGRQRKLINALIEKFRNTKLTTLLGLLDDVLPMITTDLTNAQILEYAIDLFPMLADCTIISQRIPGDGTYQVATIREMSCVVADMDAARKLLEDTFRD